MPSTGMPSTGMPGTGMPSTGTGHRLSVDPTACIGHGLCADLLPEHVYLDEWGYPVIAPDVPRRLARHARRAVRACPALALRLSRAPGAPGPASGRSGPAQQGRNGNSEYVRPQYPQRADRKGAI